MTDIRLDDPPDDDKNIEQWLNDLWRERANPLKRNGHSLGEIFWGLLDAAIVRAMQESHNRAKLAAGLYSIAEQHDRFGLSHDALQARMADRFKASSV
jgi:hypothetical protein